MNMQTTIRPDIKVVSFDIWGTLLRGNREATRPRLRLIVDMLGVEVSDVETIVEAYRTSAKRFDDLSLQTGLDYDFVARVSGMLIDAGLPVPPMPPELVTRIQKAVGRMRSQLQYRPSLLEDDLLDTLASLRDGGYRIALLSNTGADDSNVMVPLLTELGIMQYVDVAVFSAHDGRAKPNPGLFYRLARDLGVSTGEVLHIGDNVVADFAGALNAGMQALVYTPKCRTTLDHVHAMTELLSERVRVCV